MSKKTEASELIVLCQRVAHTSPYPMALFEGPEHALRYANAAFFQMGKHGQDHLLGNSVAECLPKCPGCVALLSRVSDSGHAEQHTEKGYAESWSYAAWPLSTQAVPPYPTMLLITESSELHRTASMINEALIVSAVEQNEIVENTKATAQELSSTVARKDQELDRTKEELRSLAFQLLEAQEDERRRIARELHDSFSQQLASLGMQMFELEREQNTESRHALVGQMQIQLGELTNEVRTLSHQLHPPALEHLGLVASLTSLHEDFETTHSIPIRFLAEALTAPVPLKTATTLYRILQESLWNITKHAGLDVLVTVRLQEVSTDLILSVEDTGTGFDPERRRVEGGLGLISMHERARLVGGVMTIESEPGRGTKILVRVPISH